MAVGAALGTEISERAHVVQAIGQLHDDDADVIDHGQQHFAEALGLAFPGVEDIELAELGDAVDATGHLVAETLADFVGGHASVFDEVVQEAGFDGDEVHAHAGQDVATMRGCTQLWWAQVGSNH
jgi:hypothetical protein